MLCSKHFSKFQSNAVYLPCSSKRGTGCKGLCRSTSTDRNRNLSVSVHQRGGKANQMSANFIRCVLSRHTLDASTRHEGHTASEIRPALCAAMCQHFRWKPPRTGSKIQLETDGTSWPMRLSAVNILLLLYLNTKEYATYSMWRSAFLRLSTLLVVPGSVSSRVCKGIHPSRRTHTNSAYNLRKKRIAWSP